MRKSYNYCIKDEEGKTIGHLLINELPELKIKVAHLYHPDTALPHVFDNFPFDKDIPEIAKTLLNKSGNFRPFHVTEGLNLDF